MKHYTAAFIALSLVTITYPSHAEDQVYKCGNTYSSHECENGTPLGRLELNKYKTPEAYQHPLPKAQINREKKVAQPNKPTNVESSDLSANSNSPTSVTVRGSDVDRILVQLGVKKCDEAMEKAHPELCKK